MLERSLTARRLRAMDLGPCGNVCSALGVPVTLDGQARDVSNINGVPVGGIPCVFATVQQRKKDYLIYCSESTHRQVYNATAMQ